MKKFKKIMVFLCVLLGVFLLLITWPLKVIFDEIAIGEQLKKIEIKFEEMENSEVLRPIDVSLEKSARIPREDLKTLELMTEASADLSPLNGLQEKFIETLESDIFDRRFFRNDCLQHFSCYQKLAPLSQIPDHLWKTLMGIEDVRFLDHGGIDWRGLARAIWVDLKTMSLAQGGSTLTQQLVKNLLLTQEKSVKRKVKEALLSIYLEHVLDKSEILALYFNNMYWGSLDGIRLIGIEAATHFYFQKKLKNLQPYEGLILLALLNGPHFYHPILHTKRLKTRVQQLYQKISTTKIFGVLNWQAWSEEEWNKWVGSIQGQNKNTDGHLQTSEEIKNLANFIRWQKSGKQKTFQDFILYKQMRFQLNYLQAKYPKLDLAIKVVRVKLKDQIMGDIQIDEEEKAERIEEWSFFYSKGEREQDRAIFNEKHQIGSLIKPFVYGALQLALFEAEQKNKNNFYRSPGPDELSARSFWKQEVAMSPVLLKLRNGESWSPKEGYRTYPDSVDLKTALQKSYNRPVLRSVELVGEQLNREVSDQKELIDVWSLLEGQLIELWDLPLQVPLREYPAQLLGSLELPMASLMLSYLSLFKKFCSEKNEEMSFETVVDVLGRPSMTTAASVWPKEWQWIHNFVKTGTTDLGRDTWFLRMQNDEMILVWVGLETVIGKDQQNQIYRQSLIDWQRGASGGKNAAPIVVEYLKNNGQRIGDLYCKN